MSGLTWSARHRRAAVLALLVSPGWGWAAAGCTHLLEIDGDYTLEPDLDETDTGSGGLGGIIGYGGVPSGTGGAQTGMDAGLGGSGGTAGMDGVGGSPPGPGGSAGETSTGGAPASSGGVAATGGAGATGGNAVEPDAGAVVCEPGSFTGRFVGSHKPSITFVGVSLTVQGEVRFSLMKAREPRKLILAEALFKGEFGVLSGREPSVLAVPFSATMTGEYDCETRMLKGTLENGRVFDPNAPQSFVTFAGEFSAQFSERGFSGTWREAEANPLEPTSPSRLYVGSGEFTARAP